jgi:hypothetical protein
MLSVNSELKDMIIGLFKLEIIHNIANHLKSAFGGDIKGLKPGLADPLLEGLNDFVVNLNQDNDEKQLLDPLLNNKGQNTKSFFNDELNKFKNFWVSANKGSHIIGANGAFPTLDLEEKDKHCKAYLNTFELLKTALEKASPTDVKAFAQDNSTNLEIIFDDSKIDPCLDIGGLTYEQVNP